MGQYLWSAVVHVSLGLLGTDYFDLTAVGLGLCFGISVLTQAAEMANVYRVRKTEIRRAHHAEAGRAEREARREHGKKRRAKSRAPRPGDAAVALSAKVDEMKAGFMKNALKLYARNVAIFGAVTLVTAELARRLAGA